MYYFLDISLQRTTCSASRKNIKVVCLKLAHYQSVQLLSRVQLCNPMDCDTPGFPVHHQLLKLMSIELVMPSNHLTLCCLLLLLPSIFPSIRVFPSESVFSIRWPKYWEFQLQHQSFQLIFRIDLL